MPNTYYDSSLTASQIDKALKAINGLIIQSNNGKVLYVEDGQIVAKSVSDLDPGSLPNYENQHF